MKKLRILLIIIALVCIGVAISYPIRYYMATESNKSELEELSALRRSVRDEAVTTDEPTMQDDNPSIGTNQPETVSATPLVVDTEEPQLTVQPDAVVGEPTPSQTPQSTPTTAVTDEPTSTPEGEAETTAPTNTVVPTAVPTVSAKATATAMAKPTATAAPAPSATATAEPTATEAKLETATPEPIDATEPTLNTTPWADDVTPTATPSVEELILNDVLSGNPHVEDRQVVVIVINPPGQPTPTPTVGVMELILNDPPIVTPSPQPTISPTRTPEPAPSPTPDRYARSDDALAYPYKEKVELEESKILPELKKIYAMNNDLIGWIYIDGTAIDYPVVQTVNQDFYLTHDFYGEENNNGQIIMDKSCDVFTPSYNLVVSGHHMRNGTMFGDLPLYKEKSYWEEHKIVEFDTLLERKKYVVFAAFESADYDEDEEGFRYNADIQYKREVNIWLGEVHENQLYDTEVDAAFGDEFLTLTTCDKSKRLTGRFVVVARRIREGEDFE